MQPSHNELCPFVRLPRYMKNSLCTNQYVYLFAILRTIYKQKRYPFYPFETNLKRLWWILKKFIDLQNPEHLQTQTRYFAFHCYMVKGLRRHFPKGAAPCSTETEHVDCSLVWFRLSSWNLVYWPIVWSVSKLDEWFIVHKWINVYLINTTMALYCTMLGAEHLNVTCFLAQFTLGLKFFCLFQMCRKQFLTV